jgi:hypothetical protein
MGLYHANETLRCAAFGPALLLSWVACIVFCCPAELRGQQDSPAPDKPAATQPAASPPSEAPPDAVPAPPPPDQNAATDEWGGTPRDLPQGQGYVRAKWGSEVRSMGYTVFEVLMVVLIGVPVSVLGVFGFRLLVRWMESGKSNRFAAEESRRNRQECRTWRHELKSWRSAQRRR